MRLDSSIKDELLPFLAERFFLVYYLFISAIFLYHNDLGWHIAAGDYIRSHQTIPQTDPWSFTANGQRWVNISWGWDVIASYLHERFGMIALQAVTACMGALIIAIQCALAVRMGAGMMQTLLVVLLGGIALPQFSPPDVFLAIAPQVVTLLFLPMFHFIIWRFYNDEKAASLLWLPLITILWANMHGGFVLGIGVLLAYLVDGAFASRWHKVSKLFYALCACLIAGCITPYGIHIYGFIADVLLRSSQMGISEWQPVWQRFEGGADIPAVAYMLACIPALIGALRAKVIPAPLFLICLVLYIQAWFQIRYISIFIVLSMPMMAWGLGFLGRRALKPASIEITRMARYAGIAVTLLVVSYLFLYKMDRFADLPSVRWPKQEIAYIQKHHKDRNLINHWNYGTYIIYQTEGQVKPIIDGRAESAYPLSHLKNFEKLYLTQDWTEILKNYNIGVVLWPKIDNKMLAFFVGNPDWKLEYQGELAVVYVKQQAPTIKRRHTPH